MNVKIVLLSLSAVIASSVFLIEFNKESNKHPGFDINANTSINNYKADTYNDFTETENGTVPKKMTALQNKSIDDDWCVASVELTTKDKNLAHKEAEEWALERGAIYYSNDSDTLGRVNEVYLAPYLEDSLENLFSHAKNDNEYALLAILQRNSIPLDYKDKAALNLMALGHTSNAISYLIIREMQSADEIYRQVGRVNYQVRQRVARVLAYASYGLDRLDVTGLDTYLMYDSRFNDGTFSFDPDIALSNSDLNKVNEQKNELLNYINQQREKRKLPKIENVELPRIAKHEFQSRLAITYNLYGNLIDSSSNLSKLNFVSISKNDCVQKLITLQNIDSSDYGVNM